MLADAKLHILDGANTSRRLVVGLLSLIEAFVFVIFEVATLSLSLVGHFLQICESFFDLWVACAEEFQI